jgi:hypothetical protein
MLAAQFLLGTLGFFSPGPALALIGRPPALAEALKESQLLFVARVENFDPKKPAIVCTVGEVLKGKVCWRRLSVNLAGDKEAKKLKHTPEILKRLAPGLPLVLFGLQRGPHATLYGFSNGTWFQMVGAAGNDPEALRLNFTHCEPHLRQMFKGTTADLRRIISDALSGKKPPPPPNAMEPPGLGPEVPGNFAAQSVGGIDR